MTDDVAGPDGSALSEGLGPAAWAVMAFGRVQKLVVIADVADELACKWRESDPAATAVPLYALDAKDLLILGLYREQHGEALSALGIATAKVRASAAALGMTVAEWERKFGA